MTLRLLLLVAASAFAGALPKDAPPFFEFYAKGLDSARLHLSVDDAGLYEKRFARDDGEPGELIGCGKLTTAQLKEMKPLASAPGGPEARRLASLVDKYTTGERYGRFSILMTEVRSKTDVYRMAISDDGSYSIREGGKGPDKIEAGRICREPFRELHRWAESEGLKLMQTPCPDAKKTLPYIELTLELDDKRHQGTCYRPFDRTPEGWKQFWTKVASVIAKGSRR